MHSGKNDLNYRKSESYVRSDRAEETETFRLKKDQAKTKGVVGRIIENLSLNFVPPFSTNLRKSLSENHFILLGSRYVCVCRTKITSPRLSLKIVMKIKTK